MFEIFKNWFRLFVLTLLDKIFTIEWVKSWYLLFALMVLDKAITIYFISLYGLNVEINPINTLFYPYVMLGYTAIILCITYLARNKYSDAIKILNYIFIFINAFNIGQYIFLILI